jgi:hypothetical protein
MKDTIDSMITENIGVLVLAYKSSITLEYQTDTIQKLGGKY